MKPVAVVGVGRRGAAQRGSRKRREITAASDAARSDERGRHRGGLTASRRPQLAAGIKSIMVVRRRGSDGGNSRAGSAMA